MKKERKHEGNKLVQQVKEEEQSGQKTGGKRTHVRRLDFKIKQERSRNGQTLMNDSYTWGLMSTTRVNWPRTPSQARSRRTGLLGKLSPAEPSSRCSYLTTDQRNCQSHVALRAQPIRASELASHQVKTEQKSKESLSWEFQWMNLEQRRTFTLRSDLDKCTGSRAQN